MDTPAPALPGYRVHEYRLVLALPEPLRERIAHLRERLHERHRVEKSEPRFLERLQEVARGLSPFKVELENFAAYPSHTIYIHVPTRRPFQELSKELKKLQWLMNIPGQEPHFITEPELILAQRLKPMPFIGMWMECEHSEFSGRFMADHLVLLRRHAGVGHWEVLRRLDLLELPSAVKQGCLFGG
ncbi:MAG: hypothetical protein EOO12_08585 [Chitinophagaceae bacterium]|nr:MAG: hypothetical protein EOO12_08585 [Chitinophagaceae bacterium]